MPCLEITLPKSSHQQRAQLCSRLTDLVEKVAGIEREIFRIHFYEYAPGEAGVALKRGAKSACQTATAQEAKTWVGPSSVKNCFLGAVQRRPTH